MSAAEKLDYQDPIALMAELRMRLLTEPASHFGIRPSKAFPSAYGVLMDWSLGDMTATVAALSNGRAALYTTSSFGIPGGDVAKVRPLALSFVLMASKLFGDALPARTFRLPESGTVRFFLLGFDGVRLLEADEASLETGYHPLVPLFNKAHDLFSALRSS